VFEFPGIKEALMNYKTYLLFIIFMASIFKAYGELKDEDGNEGISDSFLTYVGSVGAVLNGVCRLFWASLMDKTGFKFVYITMCCL